MKVKGIGLLTGTISPGDIISVPEPLGAGGIILSGIENAVPTVIIVMMLFAQINLLEKGECIEIMLRSMNRLTVGKRSAEGVIIFICILLNIATGLNTAAIVGTFNYLLPYMVPVVVAMVQSRMLW